MQNLRTEQLESLLSLLAFLEDDIKWKNLEIFIKSKRWLSVMEYVGVFYLFYIKQTSTWNNACIGLDFR